MFAARQINCFWENTDTLNLAWWEILIYLIQYIYQNVLQNDMWGITTPSALWAFWSAWCKILFIHLFIELLLQFWKSFFFPVLWIQRWSSPDTFCCQPTFTKRKLIFMKKLYFSLTIHFWSCALNSTYCREYDYKTCLFSKLNKS